MQCLRRGVCTVAVLLLAAAAVAADQQPGSRPVPPKAPPEPLPVSNASGWQLFHASLQFYRGRAAGSLDAWLAAEAGLSPEDVTTLIARGAELADELRQIDAQARAALLAQLPVRPLRDDIARAAGASADTPVLVREPGKTALDMVLENGLYAQIEARQRAALSRHLDALTQAFGGSRSARVAQLVSTRVIPKLVRVAPVRPLPAPQPPVAGRGTRPGKP